MRQRIIRYKYSVPSLYGTRFYLNRESSMYSKHSIFVRHIFLIIASLWADTPQMPLSSIFFLKTYSRQQRLVLIIFFACRAIEIWLSQSIQNNYRPFLTFVSILRNRFRQSRFSIDRKTALPSSWINNSTNKLM